MKLYPTFGKSSQETIDDLAKIVDNGTTTVYIPTPKGWKCSRKNCHSDVKHTHSTYPSLLNVRKAN